MSVRQLPVSTVCRISSAQVITSVASVVKELVENALDAGATSIDVKLENCGLDKIEVRDNGVGLNGDDMQFIAKKHFTSKINCFEDLGRLTTYGFRGEALASLCSVADVTITTRPTGVDVATTYQFDCHGIVTDTKPSPLPQGTTVTAIELFKRLPVRRNYYSAAKRLKDELRRVDDLLVAFAVVCYDVRFTLRHNRDVVWTKVATSDVQHALITTVGSKAVAAMSHVHQQFTDPEVVVDMFVPLPGAEGLVASRSTADRQFVCVNRRPVVMSDVTKLLRDYYSRALPAADVGRVPAAFVHLTVPPGGVDVNLEPNKHRVLLHCHEDIMKLLAGIFTDIYGPLQSDAHDDNAATHKDSDERVDDASLPGASQNSLDDVTPVTDTDVEFSPQSSIHVEFSRLEPCIPTDDIFSPSPGGVSPSGVSPGGVSPGRVSPGGVSPGGVSPGDVRDESLAEWSRGILFADSSGRIVEPVKLLTGASMHQQNTHNARLPVVPDCLPVSSSSTPGRQLTLDASFVSNGLHDNKIKGRDIVSETRAENKTDDLNKMDDHNSLKHKLKRKSVVVDTVADGNKIVNKKPRADVDKGLQSQCLERLFSTQRQRQVDGRSTRVAGRSRCVTLAFSLSQLTEQLTARQRQRSTVARHTTGKRLRLIGRLRSHGMWVCLQDEVNVVLFHLVRAQEQMLYSQLLSQHCLGTETLQTAVNLDAQALYSSERRDILLSLPTTRPTPTDPYRYCTDARLVNNGFKIRQRWDDATGRATLELVGVAKCISFYGLTDLNEIISAIEVNESCGLPTCRPAKVKYYFQGEAVRLSRQLSCDVSPSTVDDLLAELSEIVPATVTSCFHHRPFIVPLHTIPNNNNDIGVL